MSEDTAPDDAQDDAPELRRLLDKIHGEPPHDVLESPFEQPTERPADLPAQSAAGHSVAQEATPVDARPANQEPAQEQAQENIQPAVSFQRDLEPEQGSQGSEYQQSDQQSATPDLSPPVAYSVEDAPAEQAERPEPQRPQLSTPESLSATEMDQAQIETRRAQEAPANFQPAEDARHSLENMPVSFDFNLKSVESTLGNLSQLQEGEVIPLGCTPDTAVELRANGRVFARGRMVMVDEQLAIEVTSKL